MDAENKQARILTTVGAIQAAQCSFAGYMGLPSPPGAGPPVLQHPQAVYLDYWTGRDTSTQPCEAWGGPPRSPALSPAHTTPSGPKGTRGERWTLRTYKESEKMPWGTFTLLVIQLTSVFVRKAASITPSTAPSMSALSNTMKGQEEPAQTDTETGTPNPAAASHNSTPF